MWELGKASVPQGERVGRRQFPRENVWEGMIFPTEGVGMHQSVSE